MSRKMWVSKPDGSSAATGAMAMMKKVFTLYQPKRGVSSSALLRVAFSAMLNGIERRDLPVKVWRVKVPDSAL